MELGDAVQTFAEMVGRDAEDDSIDLLAAALLIARCEYPNLDVSKYVGKIESYAERVRQRLKGEVETLAVIVALNHVLFHEEGFRGNADFYFDPRNSYLNDVIDRKRGIPITLSVVYMEVARRVGLPLFGVGMPGHFLLKHYDIDGGEIFLDPYHGGQVLSHSDCEKRFDGIYWGMVELEPEFLHTVRKRQILNRILNNLRSIYMHTRSLRKALVTTDLILAIHPRSPEDVKQRGLLRYTLGQLGAAIQDLDEYAYMEPEAVDTQLVREAAVVLRRSLAGRN